MKKYSDHNRLHAAVLLYAAAFLQGAMLVSFPASSAVLKMQFGFTDTDYGALFLPQVACAVIGAVAGGALAQRLGLGIILIFSLAANAAAQAALAAVAFVPTSSALTMSLLGSGLLGLGFGASGAPFNILPARLFPARAHTALLAVHSLVGFGLALGPVLAGLFIAAGQWLRFPLTLFALALAATLTALAIAVPGAVPTPVSQSAPQRAGYRLFLLIAVLYAFAEGSFSNWAVVYLQEARDLAPATAALGLTFFWGALVAGRIGASAYTLRFAPEPLWLALPLVMMLAFWLLPLVQGPRSGLALFALAGLSCSAFFPLTVALATARFPQRAAWISSLLVAALMVGVGAGTYVIGALRALLDFERLYQVSSLYPCAALLFCLWVLRPRAALTGPASGPVALAPGLHVQDGKGA